MIIAPERGKRPDQFRSAVVRSKEPTFDPGCPFCPGNEAATPPEVLVKRLCAAGKSGWQVRVVPNKFPALTPQGSTKLHTEAGFFQKMDGFGYREIIVETPIHDRFLAAMRAEEVEAILRAYRDRYVALKEDPRVKFILIFKNHGEGAGTSLQHPHSQIVATPIVPVNLRRKYEEAVRYHDATGRCLYSDLIEAERTVGERVITETPGYIVFHPFASHVPFETWLVPKAYQSAFGQVSLEELKELSKILPRTLARLAEVLNDPDYNLVLHSAPVGDENKEYFLWHLRIVPRLTQLAGFEIGSGMLINIYKPEETARLVRGKI